MDRARGRADVRYVDAFHRQNQSAFRLYDDRRREITSALVVRLRETGESVFRQRSDLRRHAGNNLRPAQGTCRRRGDIHRHRRLTRRGRRLRVGHSACGHRKHPHRRKRLALRVFRQRRHCRQHTGGKDGDMRPGGYGLSGNVYVRQRRDGRRTLRHNRRDERGRAFRHKQCRRVHLSYIIPFSGGGVARQVHRRRGGVAFGYAWQTRRRFRRTRVAFVAGYRRNARIFRRDEICRGLDVLFARHRVQRGQRAAQRKGRAGRVDLPFHRQAVRLRCGKRRTRGRDGEGIQFRNTLRRTGAGGGRGRGFRRQTRRTACPLRFRDGYGQSHQPVRLFGIAGHLGVRGTGDPH